MLDDWLRRGRPRPSPSARASPSDLAVIAYTSGTTGRPKGAMQSHRAVVAAAVGTALMAGRTGAGSRRSAPCRSFMSTAAASSTPRCWPGSTLITLPRFDARSRCSQAIQTHRATLMDGVPTAYYYLLVASGLRSLRPFQPSALLGWRPDAAGRQVARIHQAHRLPRARGLGHDRTGRRHQRQPRPCRQQAGNHRPALSRATPSASSTPRTRPASCRAASPAS